MISRKNGGVKILLAKMSGWLSHALLSTVSKLSLLRYKISYNLES